MRGDLVQVRPLPCYLVNDMEESELKDELQQCENNTFYRTDVSIGHRGAAMQFPKHTIEPYMAAARTGASILECDVTLTADRELVCRHSQCDLHTTTNILAIPELAAKCSKPFTLAWFNADGSVKTPAFAKCYTSDMTLDDFKSLCGKMDATDTSATTVEAYMGGTATWRTDLYATWSPSMGELVDQGVNIIAPPTWMLLAVEDGTIVPSVYAKAAKAAGLDIITWTLERSGLLEDGGGWYYQTITDVIDNDGDIMTVIDVLAQDVGVIGIFADWPGTITYYANCKGM